MRRIFIAGLFLLGCLILPQPVSAQDATATPEFFTLAPAETEPPLSATPSPLGISSPQIGDVVQGVVTITGTTDFPSQTGWDVSFGFINNPTSTWFPLSQGVESLSVATLATWDTTSLSDGDFVIRLRVFLTDGIQEYLVVVHVRNYSPLESPTPTITLTPIFSATPAMTVTPTETLPSIAEIFASATPPPPSLTALPPNPAILGVNEILFNLGRGALFIFLLFGLFGALLRLRRRS